MVFDLLCYVLCGIAGIKTSEKVLPIGRSGRCGFPMGPWPPAPIFYNPNGARCWDFLSDLRKTALPSSVQSQKVNGIPTSYAHRHPE